MKAKFLQRLAVAFCTCSLLSVAGCATQPGDDGEPVVAQDVAVSRDTSFGGVYINLTIDQFNELGFAYGDSVDVEFSNGYELKDIPYFNGYYVNVGDPLLVGYPGYPYVEAALNYGDPLWDTAGLSDTDTATVTLGESGKYLNVQEAFDISYTNERADYDSDAQFANFRALSGGKMAEDAWYRSASPVDNEYGRASYVNALAEQANVGYVLDLSDSEDEVADFLREDAKANVDVSYFEKLHNAGAVATPDLSAAYPSDSFKKDLATALADLCKHDGPYLVHCIEGKDRTGFVCALLEGLSGASYDQIASDYMKTFENYYRITEQSDPDKYHAIADLNLDGMLSYLAGCERDADMSQMDFSEAAASYLRDGGMSESQIELLKSKLCGK